MLIATRAGWDCAGVPIMLSADNIIGCARVMTCAGRLPYRYTPLPSGVIYPSPVTFLPFWVTVHRYLCLAFG